MCTIFNIHTLYIVYLDIPVTYIKAFKMMFVEDEKKEKTKKKKELNQVFIKVSPPIMRILRL